MTMSPLPLSTALRQFWQQGFFKANRSLPDVAKQMDSIGHHPTSQALSNALARAEYLRRGGKRGRRVYIQKYSASGTTSAYSDILPDDLMNALARDFSTELQDLRHNFGISGTCTAFLLRKILEKLIFLVFTKNHCDQMLYDANGNMLGLKTMLAMATTTKVAGKPFLAAKTANEILGIKFLGDTAAHNPLTNVSVNTILPQLPFIITAYGELAARL